ncbi:MAG: lipid A deacylase LpxR family protein [Verrucomicrobia bacterium]|nr:lipid A deacylase LpxR family protein [Verrucomicrobiota bacterium]
MKIQSYHVRAAVFAFALNCAALHAATNDLAGAWFSGVQENDLVVRTDRHYTQGLRFTWMSAESDADAWFARCAELLPDFRAQFSAARWGTGLGQNIYTPTDLTLPTVQLNDRPYAGFLYVPFMLQRRGETAREHPVLDHWELDLGIIGPDAFGEEAQNTVHRLRGFAEAQGWANQLKDEPGLALKFQRTWRYTAGDDAGWALQALPQWGASLGTSLTYAAVGVQLRGGWRVPGDFGNETIDSLKPGSGGWMKSSYPGWGAFTFVGVEGRAMGWNDFLEGGLFHAGHRVPTHPLVGDVKFGVALEFARWDLTYTQVARTKEFVGQKSVDSFGSVALRLKW